MQAEVAVTSTHQYNYDIICMAKVYLEMSAQMCIAFTTIIILQNKKLYNFNTFALKTIKL